MKYELPALDYDLKALEPHLSGEILELHHGKHHAAYVAGANATQEKLEAARSAGDYEKINQLEKNLAFHTSGHILHSLFWKNMSPDGGGNPDGALADAVERDFGSVDALRGQFNAAGMGVQGSGWAAMSYEIASGRLIVQQIYDHQGNFAQGSVPLLVMDMWEHAFYLQYQNRKAEWVKAFWELVNWKDVGARLQKVSGAGLTLP